MLFNSWQFILIFLPVVFFVYFWLNHHKMILPGKVLLVAASLIFYSYWSINYLPLILGSIAFNFAVGSELCKAANGDSKGRLNRKFNRLWMLWFGIAANLGLLGYFKYAGFFVGNLNHFLAAPIALPNIVLPLAISFFTFQQIAFLVDNYRGLAAEYDILSYSLFVSFFPQLIAGPIVHHKEMMGQFASKWTLAKRYRNIAPGLLLFSIGLFKKVVIADTFSIWATQGFDGGSALNFYSAWATSLSYTFQIYFDFSGYCDMAMGAALLFNIKLPVNFNSPYKATDIQDFWRRWHMTLSRFLRDYLYIPLGGNKVSAGRTSLNVLITFILGGLWHGASWMFVIWGGLHGIALVVFRFWKRLDVGLPKPIAWLITFLFVNATWVFFRAETMHDAVRVFRGMVDYTTVVGGDVAAMPTSDFAWAGFMSDKLLTYFPAAVIGNILPFSAIIFALILIAQKNSVQMATGGISIKKMVAGAVLFSTAMYVMFSSTSTVFLYFNF